MTKRAHAELERQQAAAGLRLSWSGLFLLVLTLVSISSALGFGLSWAREHNYAVRHHLDRLEELARRPFARFATRPAHANHR